MIPFSFFFRSFLFLFVVLLFPVSSSPADHELKILPSSMPAMLVFPTYLHSYGIRKATQAKLKVFLGPFASFNDPQGIAAIKMKSRDDPKSVDDNDEVTVYGVNSGNCEIIYNTSMYAITSFGTKGPGTGQFNFPMAISADEDGRVYVADTKNHRIVKLFNPKKEVRWVKTFGSHGSGTGQLNEPEGVALDSRGRVYVADTRNHRVQVFDSTGAFLNILGKAGDTLFNLPTQIAVSDAEDHRGRSPENALYVIDRHHTRLRKISPDGKVLATAPSLKGERFDYLCLDYFQQVYVTDKTGGRLLKYDRDLNALGAFGKPGTGDREFREPRGIAIWKPLGQVFVAERDGAQYYWIGTDCLNLTVARKNPAHFEIRLLAQEPSKLTAFHVNGPDTLFFFRRHFILAGAVSLPFRKDEPSLSTITVRLEPTYSSFTYFAKQWECPIRKE